ncbi:MAG TPA: hypothetical protein VN783_09375 [Thermoanaerobaculia bacterium]|nr:hypothetical protein [Thermoanaerobaculia bacterium]
MLVVATALVALPLAAAQDPFCPGGTGRASIVGARDSPSFFDPRLLEPQEKVCIFICTESEFSTGMHWGMGANCTDSNNDLANQVGTEASSTGSGLCTGAGYISYCGFRLVVTTGCHWDYEHSMYVTDGYGNIKCKDYC